MWDRADLHQASIKPALCFFLEHVDTVGKDSRSLGQSHRYRQERRNQIYFLWVVKIKTALQNRIASWQGIKAQHAQTHTLLPATGAVRYKRGGSLCVCWGGEMYRVLLFTSL